MKTRRKTTTVAASKHLERRGDSFRVAVAVPRDLRPIFRTSIIRQPLGVLSMAQAETLKHDHVARIMGWFREARLTGIAPAEFQGGNGLGLVEVVMVTRDEVKRLQAAGMYDEAAELVTLTAEDLAEKRGEGEAGQFVQAMREGGGTTIMGTLETWITKAKKAARTSAERRVAVTKFIEWYATDKGKTKALVTFDMVDRRAALDYITEGLADMHPATKQKHVGALRVLWEWAIDYEIFKAELPHENRKNPWSVKKDLIGDVPKAIKRAFTDAEVRQLIDATQGTRRYTDILTLLALTGMRLSEAMRLKAQDVDPSRGVFLVRQGKTDAAVRVVPIHSGLLPIVTARIKDKPKDGRVFHDIPLPKNPEQGAGHVVTKYVGRLRDRLKIGEGEAEGRRQAAVDTHSLRRWFIRKAADALMQSGGGAGFSPWTLAQVVGHEVEDEPLGMTMVRYAGQDDDRAMKACVEAVKLPG